MHTEQSNCCNQSYSLHTDSKFIYSQSIVISHFARVHMHSPLWLYAAFISFKFLQPTILNFWNSNSRWKFPLQCDASKLAAACLLYQQQLDAITNRVVWKIIDFFAKLRNKAQRTWHVAKQEHHSHFHYYPSKALIGINRHRLSSHWTMTNGHQHEAQHCDYIFDKSETSMSNTGITQFNIDIQLQMVIQIIQLRLVSDSHRNTQLYCNNTILHPKQSLTEFRKM